MARILKSNAKKIVICTLVIVLGIISFNFFEDWQQKNNLPSTAGEIMFTLIDENSDVVVQELLEFDKNESFFGLLKQNYYVVCADMVNLKYVKDPTCSKKFLNGYVVLQIETVETDFYNNFLAIYVNDVYATNGFSSLRYKNNDNVKVIFEEIKK